jgi:hypothetical protein
MSNSSTSIKENALKKRKSIKSYRKEQERITQMRNKLFEEQLHERRQSELNKINHNNNSRKSVRTKQSKYRKQRSSTRKSKSK